MSNLEKRALRAGSFVHNNGKVLRTVNILRLKYNKLTGVQSVLEDDGIAEDEFLDSVNFLTEEGYIHLRRISNKEPAALADTDYTALEAKLTGKGIRLLAGGIEDDMIEAQQNRRSRPRPAGDSGADAPVRQHLFRDRRLPGGKRCGHLRCQRLPLRQSISGGGADAEHGPRELPAHDG